MREIGAWFIHASTSEVYGAGGDVPFTEESPVGGTSPYAVAKIAADEFLRFQGSLEVNPLRYSRVRSFNTVGRSNVRNEHFVVERTVTGALRDHAISLHDKRPLRDFCFRTDHARMYIAVLDHMKEAMGETFIMSTGDTWSIEDMARHVQGLMLKHTGHEVTLHFASEPDRPLDIPVLQGSSAKARRLLGWEPEYTIAEAIEQAFIEWQEVIGG